MVYSRNNLFKMRDGAYIINLFDYESIATHWIATGLGDDHTTGCSLDCPYFKKYYRLIAIDLSIQQKLDTDPTATQQILLEI